MLNKNYYLRLAIGSILFGLITFGNELYKDGSWHLSAVFEIVYGTLGFAILFHILFGIILKNMKQINLIKFKDINANLILSFL